MLNNLLFPNSSVNKKLYRSLDHASEYEAPNDHDIDVVFATSGIHEDLDIGPAPMVTITRNFLSDNAGTLLGINNNVSLDGFIFVQNGDSTSGLSTTFKDKLNKLEQLLNVGRGDLEITYDGTDHLLAKNAKVTSFNIDKSPDNSVRSIPYKIELSYYDPMEGTDIYRISSSTETWSIEPTSEYRYTSISKVVNKETETEPSASVTNGSNVYFSGFPEFRVTRNISAVGVADEGFVSHHDHNLAQEYNFTSDSSEGKDDAYMQAKKWVEDRLILPFDSANNTDPEFSPSIFSGYGLKNTGSIYLYNHNRNINYSITAGSYSVTDSWTALPSGVKFIEDYSMEVSTDERYVKTVKIQGTIKGLHLDREATATQKDQLIDDSAIVTKGEYDNNGQTGTVNSPHGSFSDTKIKNAKDGWLDMIKPHLYNRASSAINDADKGYTTPYLPSNYNGGQMPPGDPTISQDRRLNYIPINTSETYDPFKGIITYNYEYDNSLKVFSGVISENVDINFTGPGAKIAEVMVLGRPLGPVIFDLDTKAPTRKTVNIDLVVVPPQTSAGFSLNDTACPLYTGGYIFKLCEQIIEGQKPFGSRLNPPYIGNAMSGGAGNVFLTNDTYNWDASNGRYSRQVEWTYSICNHTISNGDYFFVKHLPS